MRPKNRTHSKAAAHSGLPASTLTTAKFKIGRKAFFFSFLEHPEEGRSLRITQADQELRHSIEIPVSGLTDFKHFLEQILKNAQ